MSKILILVLTTLLCSVNVSYGASRADAEAAFAALSGVISTLANELTTTIDTTIDNINEQLEQTEQDLFSAILAMANATESKINRIAAEAEAAGVDAVGCIAGIVNEIELFRTRLTQRTRSCTVLTSDTLPFIKSDIWTDVIYYESEIMGCHAISLGQCTTYTKSDDCYDFFIENLERASKNMNTNFGLIKANFINRVTGLRMPCKDIIDVEMITYPNLLVNSVSKCVTLDIRNSIPTTCNDQLDIKKIANENKLNLKRVFN